MEFFPSRLCKHVKHSTGPQKNEKKKNTVRTLYSCFYSCPLLFLSRHCSSPTPCSVLGQDRLNSPINYHAIIGSVWRSLGIYCLRERVINNRKKSTKLHKSGYFYFPPPFWQDWGLSAGRRCWLWWVWLCKLGPRCPWKSPKPGVPEGRVVVLCSGLRWMNFMRWIAPSRLFDLYGLLGCPELFLVDCPSESPGSIV